MNPFPLWVLCLTLTSAALVASVAAPPAFAIDQSRAPKTKQLPKSVLDQIKKCDLAELACKKKCDDTIVDIDNQIELCKQKCGKDRAMCSMMRQGPGAGTGAASSGGVNPAAPPPATRN